MRGKKKQKKKVGYGKEKQSKNDWTFHTSKKEKKKTLKKEMMNKTKNKITRQKDRQQEQEQMKNKKNEIGKKRWK